MRIRFMVIPVAVIAVVVVSLMLVGSRDSKSTEANASANLPAATTAKLAPEPQTDKFVISEVKTSGGQTIVVFSNGMTATVSSDMEGKDFLKPGFSVRALWQETDGLPVIQKISPNFTPPACTCEE